MFNQPPFGPPTRCILNGHKNGSLRYEVKAKFLELHNFISQPVDHLKALEFEKFSEEDNYFLQRGKGAHCLTVGTVLANIFHVKLVFSHLNMYN